MRVNRDSNGVRIFMSLYETAQNYCSEQQSRGEKQVNIFAKEDREISSDGSFPLHMGASTWMHV